MAGIIRVSASEFWAKRTICTEVWTVRRSSSHQAVVAQGSIWQWFCRGVFQTSSMVTGAAAKAASKSPISTSDSPGGWTASS